MGWTAIQRQLRTSRQLQVGDSSIENLWGQRQGRPVRDGRDGRVLHPVYEPGADVREAAEETEGVGGVKPRPLSEKAPETIDDWQEECQRTSPDGKG